MEIKLIAMDLDGTCLQPDRVSFSPRLNAALEAAHGKGVAILPVTGRQFKLLPPPLQCHPVWENLAVVCNGGQIRRLTDGQLLMGLDLKEEALGQLLVLARELALPIEFSVDSRLHLTRQDYECQLSWPNLAFHRDVILAAHGRFVPSLEPITAGQVEKVNLLCITPEKREAVLAGLEAIDVSAVWASSSSLEITHSAATKGNGLAAACGILGIPMKAVMALGDSGNDLTMLRAAGLGVAMGNAPDFVKAAADIVGRRYDEDGAAEAIETFVLT